MHRLGVQLLRRIGVATALLAIPLVGLASPPGEADFPAKKSDRLGAVQRQREATTEAPTAGGVEKGRSSAGKETAPPPSPRGRDTFIQPASTTWPRNGVRPGIVRLVRGTEILQLRVLDKRQQFLTNTLPEFALFLRAKDGSDHPIDARLVTMLAVVSDHFGGRDIIVTSGFRPYSARQYTRQSNHNEGRAIDFAVHGVANETLRDFCRTFRNVGVGYYPNSAFVHLDVRETSGYWVDYAAPGQPPRYHRPQSKDEADETVAEVEGMASVDAGGSTKAAGEDVTRSDTPMSGTPAGKGPRRESAGEHSVFQAR